MRTINNRRNKIRGDNLIFIILKMDYIITYIDFHKRIDSSRGLRRNMAEMHKASETYRKRYKKINIYYYSVFAYICVRFNVFGSPIFFQNFASFS